MKTGKFMNANFDVGIGRMLVKEKRYLSLTLPWIKEFEEFLAIFLLFLSFRVFILRVLRQFVSARSA